VLCHVLRWVVGVEKSNPLIRWRKGEDKKNQRGGMAGYNFVKKGKKEWLAVD